MLSLCLHASTYVASGFISASFESTLGSNNFLIKGAQEKYISNPLQPIPLFLVYISLQEICKILDTKRVYSHCYWMNISRTAQPIIAAPCWRGRGAKLSEKNTNFPGDPVVNVHIKS